MLVRKLSVYARSKYFAFVFQPQDIILRADRKETVTSDEFREALKHCGFGDRPRATSIYRFCSSNRHVRQVLGFRPIDPRSFLGPSFGGSHKMVRGVHRHPPNGMFLGGGSSSKRAAVDSRDGNFRTERRKISAGSDLHCVESTIEHLSH